MRTALLLALCLAIGTVSAGPSTVGGPTSPSGVEATIDLPNHKHLINKVGTNRLGLCVFTSVEMSAEWCGESALVGFRDWMTEHPGGGDPDKLARKITEICKQRGVPEPLYIQYEGNNPEIIELALKNGLFPAVTYGYSPRYGQEIAHMVNAVHLDAKIGGILDNNYPGTIEWMSRDEFVRRWTLGGGGWAAVLLSPGPPPAPMNSLGPLYGGRSANQWGPAPCPELPRRSADPTGKMIVHCPHKATLIVNGETMPDERTTHYIQTTPLVLAKVYTYHITATWTEAGRKVTGKKSVEISAGQTINVFMSRYDCQPPEPIKEEPQPNRYKKPNFGINEDELYYDILKGERYSCGGQCISREDAHRLLRQASLPDESDRLILSVIGTPDQTKRIMDDLKGPLAPFLAGFRKPKSYLPDEWAITGVGFKTTRTPYISIQRPDGTELHAQTDYDDGAEGLKRVFTKLRKPNPSYDPTKTPDLRKEQPLPSPLTPVVHGTSLFIVLLMIAIAAFIAYKLPVLRKGA